LRLRLSCLRQGNSQDKVEVEVELPEAVETARIRLRLRLSCLRQEEQPG